MHEREIAVSHVETIDKKLKKAGHHQNIHSCRKRENHDSFVSFIGGGVGKTDCRSHYELSTLVSSPPQDKQVFHAS